MSVPFENKVVVRSAGQKIFVDPAGRVTIVHAGPPGPPGAPGQPGTPGEGGAGGQSGYGLASMDRISLTDQPGNPVVTYNTETWDSSEIREPGQAIYDPVTDLWIIPYTVEEYMTQVAAVISEDGGETWSPHPQNPILPNISVPGYGGLAHFDDPYVAKTVDGLVWRDSLDRAHIYVEEKEGFRHNGIGLWVSAPNTLDDWTYIGSVLGPGLPGDWDESDKASPVVIHDGTRLNMLYEGRYIPDTGPLDEWDAETTYQIGDVIWTGDPDPIQFWRCTGANIGVDPEFPNAVWEEYFGQLGATGHAVSLDEGLTWTVHGANPILPVTPPGTWAAASIVVDDIIKVDNRWVLLVHGLDTHDGIYVVGRFVTEDDPIDWTEESFTELVGNPYDLATNTVMCWGNDPTQALVIRQLASNPGVGQRLDRVYVTPTVGVEQTDLTAVENRLDGVETRMGAAEGLLGTHGTSIDSLITAQTDVDAAITNNDDILNVGRISPKTEVSAFSFDTEDFGGFGPSPTSDYTLPDAEIIVDHLNAPWPPLTSCSAGGFSPAAATPGHRLLGLKARVALDVASMTDVFIAVNVLDGTTFDNVFGSVGFSNDMWSPIAPGYLIVTPTDLLAPETEMVFLLDEPIDNPAADALLFSMGFSAFGPSPSIPEGSSLLVKSVEWLWDTDQPETASGVTPDPAAGTENDTLAVKSGAYELVVPGRTPYGASASDGDGMSIYDGFLTVETLGAPASIVLPNLTTDTQPGGTLHTIIGRGGGAVTLTTPDTALINGAATYTMQAVDYAIVELTHDGSNWFVLENVPAEPLPADPEWTEVARYTTASSNDWPTFNSVPDSPRYRLRWSYSPTHTPSGNGGLSRSLLLNFDDDVTSGNYASGTTAGASTGTAIVVNNALGQGGGAFGEVVLQRTAKRFAGAPVLRYGINSRGTGVTSTGAVSSGIVFHHGTYVKPDGTIPPLSKWALSASNNDSWAIGITFILETASLP